MMNLPKVALATSAVVASMFVTDSVAQYLDEDLKIQLEQPYFRAELGQISEIRGWALHPTEEVDVVEIYIDGQYFSMVPVGGARRDVFEAYPNAVKSFNSGYAQTVNFKSLPAGHHYLEVVAYTVQGSYNVLESEFCVDEFTGEFITDPDTISLKTVDRFHTAERALIMERVTVGEKEYNIELIWNQATQGFIIEQTTPYEYIDDYSHHCRRCSPDM